MKRFASSVCVAAWLCVGGSAAAQDQPADSPAHIAFVDGVATLERDGRVEAAPTSMPLLAGDRLRTESGRVEVLFGDGANLQLDAGSTVDFQSDDVLRLLRGRVRLSIQGPAREVSYRIDAASGWVQIREPGEYRVALSRGDREAELELAVLRGSAQLMNGNGETALRTGERALARAEVAPSAAYVFNSAAWDDFDRWSDDRRGERAGASAQSAQYLPESVRPYASTFDRYGGWRYDASYGYVWYPTVRAGWRPYYNGRWASFPSFGWTWIGTDAWSWPTHHYGRWGVSGDAWFWIPGRTWGPAWVSWAYAPGYVSWCPLGWDNRASIQFVTGSYHGRHDPWSAWTVVPHQRFGVGFVHANVIAGLRIDGRTRGAFVVRQTAPQIRGYAVPRGAAPLYAAGLRRGRPGPYADRGFADRQGGLAQSRPYPGNGPASRGVGEARRPGRADDAAAVLRNGRPGSPAAGGNLAASSRPQRDVASAPRPDVRPDLARPAGGGERTATGNILSYRGRAVPRDGQSRTQAGGSTMYRGGPAASDRAGSNSPQGFDGTGYRRSPGMRPSAPAANGPAPYSTPERTRAPQGYGSMPPRTAPPGWSDRGGRPSPGLQSGGGPRAVPRQAPQAAPPSYGSGGVERRSQPQGPRADSPSRRDSPPQGDGAAPRGRPTGQERGGAARRR